MMRSLALLLVAACVPLVGGCSHFRGNIQEVECGRLYRSAQLSDDRLSETIERLGIRTVLNLRGETPDEDWWREEVAVCERLGVAHHDEHWSAMRPPDPASLERVVALLETAEQPILVHCKAGMHRAATMAAIWRLMRGDRPAEARQEFGFLFCDHGVGDVVYLYDGSCLPFGRWAREVYPQIHADLEAEAAAAGPPPRSLRSP